jgi:hypothetical protein
MAVVGAEQVSLFTNRQSVCTARVVGQETVEVTDYESAPVKQVTRDVVEWDCHPLLESIDQTS